MGNHTVNGKKIGKGAGEDQKNTLVNVLAVSEIKTDRETTQEQAFAELENGWNLEVTSETQRKSMALLENREGCRVFSAKDHNAYVEAGKVIKREVVEKDTKKTVQQAEIGD